VLELARGLPRATLSAIAGLERRVVAVDGGRLKLEWGHLGARSPDEVADVLWWEGERLAGFLGLYAFGPHHVELAGMVDPADRGHGIGTALLDAALPLLRTRGGRPALLIVPRASAGGGARLEHSVFAVVRAGAPADGPEDPGIQVRPARPDERGVVGALLAAAFGWDPGNDARNDTADHTASGLLLRADRLDTTWVVEYERQPVGTVRLTIDRQRDGGRAGVYGFAIDPTWQGRGIGRDALRRVCRLARERGAQTIGLEVAAENDRALGLYTSLGFQTVTTEDYYELPLTGPTRGDY
jgi:ribosomal protein S18 acetylase RimI-like enzyme